MISQVPRSWGQDQKQRPAQAGGTKACITLDELYAMQEEVRNVVVPDSINELMDNILCELRRRGIHVSDRKYFGYAPLVQARAWLSSCDEVKPCDLLILRAYLWTTPEEMETVETVIREICENPLGDRIREIHGMGAEAFEEFQNDAPAKFRSEFITLYNQVTALSRDAQSDRDREAVQGLLDDLEDMSRQAHNAVGFTHTPLSEIAALQ